MYQGTTPALMFQIDGYDLRDKTVYLTFHVGRNQLLTKTGTDLIIVYDDSTEASQIGCILTQEETLAMSELTNVVVQARFIDKNGTAWASTKAKINVDSVLLKDVITYEGGSNT